MELPGTLLLGIIIYSSKELLADDYCDVQSYFKSLIIFRTSIMEGRGEGVAASKPTGANKRKGANPVRQIINDGVVADGGGVGGGGGPLDLSLQHGDMQPRSSSKKVILSVPQYKLVTSSSTTSASALSVSSSSRLSDPPPAPVTSLKQEPG